MRIGKSGGMGGQSMLLDELLRLPKRSRRRGREGDVMASKKKQKVEAEVAPTETPAQQPEEVRESTGAKVTISATGIYRIGDVEFGIDRNSVELTRQLIAGLPRDTWESVITLHGDTVDPDTSDETVRKQAQSLIQNDWYTILKGEIPMSVQKNHAKRTKEFKSAAKVDKSKAEKKERSLMTFRASAKLNCDKMKGQAQVVASFIDKLGETNVKRLAEAIEKSGKLVTKKQDALAVCRFYVSQFKSQGLVVKV
jgi:hypothetical protein